MANRLSTIMTKTGDAGETGLGDGSRVAKTHERIEALGDVDELNASIGIARAWFHGQAVPKPSLLHDLGMDLEVIQHALFQVGSALAVPGYAAVTADVLTHLEIRAQYLNGLLQPLEEFILPGGSMLSAHLHLSRAICRRAERHTWALSAIEPQMPELLMYLNRLSDYLFIAARAANASLNMPDVLWASPKMKQKAVDQTTATSDEKAAEKDDQSCMGFICP
jgi:cob(I)alamin adenosyltransferase